MLDLILGRAFSAKSELAASSAESTAARISCSWYRSFATQKNDTPCGEQKNYNFAVSMIICKNRNTVQTKSLKPHYLMTQKNDTPCGEQK